MSKKVSPSLYYFLKSFKNWSFVPVIMEVLIEKTGKKTKIRFKGKVCALLSKLKINPETVIVVRNGELITEEVELLDKDRIKIMSVISGG